MRTSIKDKLKEIIPEEKQPYIKRAFEIVGDIAITEIPQELNEYQKEIGEAILNTNPAIKTVLKKNDIHKGKFRTQELTYIAGENKKETIYKENNVKILLNPENTYFSPRLSTEREIISKKIEENESICVMFSGVGPYSYVIAKKQPNIKNITSIELNPNGHYYAVKNKETNKNILKNSQLYKTLKEFYKLNNIPFHDKQLLKNITELKLQFYNEDMKKFKPKLPQEIKGLDKKKEILNLNNIINKQPSKICEDIKNNYKKVYIDIDSIKEREIFIPYLILFSHTHNFYFTFNEKTFICKNYEEKNVLLKVLENNKIKQIEDTIYFDRIIMPLPRDAHNFLDEALSLSKKNTTIHMYDFIHESEYPQETENKILEAGKKNNRLIEIIETRKVGQYSPGKYRVCCDFKILE